jgi:hypothetical protein
MSEQGSGIERPYGITLPEGVRHLHGSLYLVRFELLQLSDPEVNSSDSQEQKYKFHNPRILTEKGQRVLFDKQNSLQIRESIRDKTLMNPFVCRWRFEAENELAVKRLTIQIVGGERRHRAISWLRNKRELVKDPAYTRLNDNLEYEYEYKPADQVYEYVPCQIYAAKSDIDALSLSYTENDCRINQGEGADVAMVMELRRCLASDEEILSAMTKEESWLRDTDHLIEGLMQEALTDLLEDRIDREGALELLKIRQKFGDEVAGKALAIANDASQKDYERKFLRCTERIEEAMTEREIAEGAVEEAKYQGSGVEVAEQVVTESTAKVKRTIGERDREKPTTGGGHVRNAHRSMTGGTHRGSTPPTPKSTVLRAQKIQEFYLDPIEELIRMGGKSTEIDDGEADLDSLALILKMLRAVMGGDSECMEIIRLHYKKKRE